MSSELTAGGVWKYGDGVDTDLLAPGIYMKGSMEELASHCLEAIDPSFARQVKSGDIVVAGKNFGIGSSREQAAQVLRMLGVTAVIARSFGGIFYRNAFNLGLYALVSDDVDRIEKDHRISVDPLAGRILNETTGETLTCEKVPEHLAAIVSAGGLIPHLEKTLRKTL
ncbi:3-isopropylmalate dehydratase [Denitrobaculum tricleocarpae]|uniref:3-isopropylmalate dehydratase n=1 Tax=Denitrobaculum tricleocarpae TaxID=2591009 RepID=A0A545TG20_9PROT|nr:3-isopropylmalate dehydratase [Denitrobaculum tricleocarpae]TQV76169.1 3-isopropylmalate dehydratase [Denitrobaculum tricleocarpae]